MIKPNRNETRLIVLGIILLVISTFLWGDILSEENKPVTIRYILVAGNGSYNWRVLQKRVNDHIAMGYTPIGNPVLGSPYPVQAMIRQY
jgi:hypothetical protein